MTESYSEDIRTQTATSYDGFSGLANLLTQQNQTFGLLSRLFASEADAALLTSLKAMHFPANTGNEHLDEGYLSMARYLSNLWENSPEELSIDFSRTFFGNGIDAYSAAYPYESVYTSEKRLTMQGARDEVLAIYRSQGIDKSYAWKEGEDHIAAELEFAEILCRRAAQEACQGNEEGVARYLRTLRGFMVDHLAPFAQLLAQDMAKFSRTGFYSGAALVLDGFVEVQLAFLDELLETDEAESEPCCA